MDVRYENITYGKDGVPYPFRTHVQTTFGAKSAVDAHYHEFIEILYCTEGSFYILLDGEGHTFSQGDMVIINSMEVHSVRALTEEANTYVVIRFTPELLYTTTLSAFETKYVLPFTMKTATHQKVFKKEELASTNIPGLLLTIIEEGATKSYGFELAIRTHIGQIFLWILRHWHNMGMDLNISSGLGIENIERLEIIFDYVDKHYDETITIAHMADICNMSYSYFSRFFKKAMNRNFSDYVNLIRISKAEHLLATTDEPITNVALMVGFGTTSYFIEQFKKFKRLTPKKFRQSFLDQI